MSAAPSPAHDLAPPIRVLYAASSPADGEFVRAEASAHSPLISITCATGADETLTCLDAIGPFDAVLVDPQLPDGSAQALISRIRQRNPGIGIVACVTGDDASLATPALDAGAHAWIPKRKDTLAQLYPVFRRAIDRSRVAAPAERAPGEEAPADIRAVIADDDEQAGPGRFDAALAMREATLMHEAERARLEDALAAERAEVTRLAVELAALRTAHDTERQDLEGRVRAAQEAARAERESMRTVLAEREQARADLASELIAREEQYETVLGDLERAVAVREGDIVRLTEELAAARAAGAAAASEPLDRARVDARAEAGRLIAAVVDDVEALLARLDAARAAVRTAIEAGQATADTVHALDRTLDDARALVRMLRAFSRREMQRAQPTQLPQTIESLRPVLVRLFQDDVQLQVDVAPECGPVAIDPVHLELALVTAVLAVRAQLPTGGRVTIAAKPAPGASEVSGTGGATPGAEIDITARRWRHDIAIPELASDRWLAPTGSPGLNLAPIDAVLKPEGGWVDTSASGPDAIVIRMGLAGA